MVRVSRDGSKDVPRRNVCSVLAVVATARPSSSPKDAPQVVNACLVMVSNHKSRTTIGTAVGAAAVLPLLPGGADAGVDRAACAHDGCDGARRPIADVTERVNDSVESLSGRTERGVEAVPVVAKAVGWVASTCAAEPATSVAWEARVGA